MDENLGDRGNLAVGLANLADDQSKIGALRDAEANLRRRIDLCREVEDEFKETIGHQELGRLLVFRGAWAGAEEELMEALELFEKQQHVQGQGVTWAYRAQRALLLARDAALSGDPESLTAHCKSALDAARRALELADETARTQFPYPRDYVDAYWLLGAAHRPAGDLDAADRHLSEALTRCRGINLVAMEAGILLDLARLRHAQGHRKEAQRHAEEARIITERCEYVLQGADVHLFLAEMALEEGDREQALEHARQARTLATCDGPPDYTYKVAYDQAGALLAKLGELPDG
jgi:tetratricopeptide (TPR) repeat protein